MQHGKIPTLTNRLAMKIKFSCPFNKYLLSASVCGVSLFYFSYLVLNSHSGVFFLTWAHAFILLNLTLGDLVVLAWSCLLSVPLVVLLWQ